MCTWIIDASAQGVLLSSGWYDLGVKSSLFQSFQTLYDRVESCSGFYRYTFTEYETLIFATSSNWHSAAEHGPYLFMPGIQNLIEYNAYALIIIQSRKFVNATGPLWIFRGSSLQLVGVYSVLGCLIACAGLMTFRLSVIVQAGCARQLVMLYEEIVRIHWECQCVTSLPRED